MNNKMKIDQMKQELTALKKRDEELFAMNDRLEINLQDLRQKINEVNAIYQAIRMADHATAERYSMAERRFAEEEKKIALLKQQYDSAKMSNTMGMVPKRSSSVDDDENIDEFQWQEKIAEANEELHGICAEMDGLELNKLRNIKENSREKSKEKQSVIEEAQSALQSIEMEGAVASVAALFTVLAIVVLVDLLIDIIKHYLNLD